MPRLPTLLITLLFVLSAPAAFADAELEDYGRYLVLELLGCQGCHTERNLDKFGYPPKADRLLGGGLIFRADGDRAVSPNITPYALSSWTDEQILDAMTRGIRPDGRVLSNHMPFENYRLLPISDLKAIVAYLRTVDPVEAGPYPAEFIPTPGPIEPDPGQLTRPASGAPSTELGEYLVAGAGCNGCHRGVGDSSVDQQLMAGGREFILPGRGMIRAANLTPDPDTGIGNWTRETWLARFKAMQGSENIDVAPGQVNTTMHWWQYAYLPESELSAVYDYLRTLPAASNAVVRFEPLSGTVVSPNWSERDQP